MGTVHLDFPVFVQHVSGSGTRRYRVAPLFDPDLGGEGRTFGQASRKCLDAVRHCYRGSCPDLERLQWLVFSPDYRVDHPQLALGRGFEAVEGRVTLVSFAVGEHRYGVFPRLGTDVFAAPSGVRWTEFVEYAQTIADDRVRALKKAAQPDRVDLRPRLEQKGDFVTNVQATVTVANPRFSFELSDPRDLFAELSGQREFSGAAELPRVATDLNGLFPDDLLRTFVPDDRVDDLLAIYAAKQPPPTAIVGPPGAGRTTLLHEAIHRQLEVHEGPHDKARKTWLLDPLRVISGMAIIGQWQRRAEAILTHVESRLRRTYAIHRTDALVVDNPVALIRVGRSAGSSLTLSTVLRPWLERRTFPVFVEATPEEWTRVEEEDRAFADLFQVIRIDAPPRERALRMILRRRARIEQIRRTSFGLQAIERSVALAERYPGHKVLPGAVLDPMERLAARFPDGSISGDDVDRAFLGASGLQPRILDTRTALPPGDLRAEITGKLIGQPQAVDALVDAIGLLRAGLVDPDRPVASMLFVGPTGVGKTEAAKVLCATLFSGDAHLVRFDMNEFVDAGAAARLVGSAFRPEGQLTSRVRHQPFCVLLLDEIEKAHPSVHDLLLQVLDEGRLTDAMGRLVRFNRAVIVMTSNVGAREAGRSLGFDRGVGQLVHTYKAAIARAFRPEFVNRIDRTVVFTPLGPDHIREVATLQLRRLLARDGFLRRTTLLRVTDAAMDRIAETGFDARMGARAMKRALEGQIVSKVARTVIDLAPEQPVVLEVDLVDGQIDIDASGLPYAQASEGSTLLEQVQALDADAVRDWKIATLRRLLERVEERLPDSALVASSGPAGTQVEVGEEVALRTRITEQLDAFDPVPGETTMAHVPTHAIRTRPRATDWPRRWSFGVRYWDRHAHQRIRDYLESVLQEAEQGRPEPTYARTGLQELATLDLRCRFLGRSGPPGARIALKPVAGGHADLPALVRAYRHLLLEPDARGRLDRERPTSFDDAGQTLVLPGAHMLDLLASEAGIHLVYPEVGPPVAVQVAVRPWAPDGAPGAVEPVPDRVVRIYCPPGTAGERGSVTDLRSGTVLDYALFDESWLLTWLYDALPTELRLEAP